MAIATWAIVGIVGMEDETTNHGNASTTAMAMATPGKEGTEAQDKAPDGLLR